MEITDPTRRVIVVGTIDRSVIRGTLTPTGGRRDFHGWLELNTALEAMLDPGADHRPNRLATSAAVRSARGVLDQLACVRPGVLMGQRQGCVGRAGSRAWVGVLGGAASAYAGVGTRGRSREERCRRRSAGKRERRPAGAMTARGLIARRQERV
jgi:hypothetical protein